MDVRVLTDVTQTIVMKIKFEPVKGGFEDKIKRLKRAEENPAEVGWFAEQGEHPTAEMSYPRLAQYHANGDEGVTPRPMLDIAIKHYRRDRNPEIGRAISAYLMNPTETNLNNISEVLGRTLQEKIKWVIGNPSVLEVTNNPTPLHDSGALHDHVAYKTKKDPTLKT